jgi:hypothetical protein
VDGVVSGGHEQLGYTRRHRLVDEEPHLAAGKGSSRSSTAAAAYRSAS